MEHANTHNDISETDSSTERDNVLSTFQEAVGIIEVQESPSAKKRNGHNLGIYPRVIQEESKARLQYHLLSFIIDSCLLLQIIIAAALTALGASRSSHVIVTIFGALNTVIAGILSFTKGQGLPNRLRKYQNALRRVREYIEQRERDFRQPDNKRNLDHEIQTVLEMYEAVRQTDEDNDPDAYATSKSGTPANGKSITDKGLQNPLSARIERLGPLLGKSRNQGDAELGNSGHLGNDTMRANPS